MLFAVTVSFELALLIKIVILPASFIYSVYFLTLRGQTIGKKGMDLKVVRMDGGQVTRQEAMLRGMVDLTFALAIGLHGVFIAFMTLQSRAAPQGFVEAVQVLGAGSGQGFGQFASYLSLLYVIAQIICFFATPERRAIHDLIAGTRVIRIEPEGLPYQDESK